MGAIPTNPLASKDHLHLRMIAECRCLFPQLSKDLFADCSYVLNNSLRSFTLFYRLYPTLFTPLHLRRFFKLPNSLGPPLPKRGETRLASVCREPRPHHPEPGWRARRVYLFRIRSEAIVAVNDPATAIPTNIVITPTKRPAVVIG